VELNYLLSGSGVLKEGRSSPLGVCFNRLSKQIREAVAEHVRAEYDKLLLRQPSTYIMKHAQADPQGWRDGMCELVAADPKRVREIMQAAGNKPGQSEG
jgi:hypothetical protein